MIPIVTSLTLDRATLCRWVQSALAAEVLTVPSEVIDIQVDEEIVHIDLRPVAASPAVTMLPTEPPAIVKPSTNGNGHKPARSGQFITDAHKTFIRTHTDWTGQKIADELAVPASAVYPYLAQYRKEAKQQPAPAAQPFPAEAE